MRLLVAVAAMLFALPAFPQSDRILLPLVVEAPVSGARGSLWRTDLVVRNAGPHDVWISVGCEDVCPPAILRPGDAVLDPPISGLPRGAAYLFGPPDRLEQIQVSLRVRDLTRQGDSYGTELPVLRVGEITERTLTFLDVPGDIRFRRTLRLYSPSTRAVPVTIRIRDLAEPDEALVEMQATILPNPHKPFQYPAYAEILDLGDLRGRERLFVEVSAQGEQPIWGFFSVTNNETQQVTTITPR